MSELYDITIVGGGPVGLFAAFYAHLRQAKVQIIDSLPQLGGQPAILYPEKQILDVPGFPNLTGEELTNRLLEQLEGFETPVHLNETVLEIEKEDDVFKITYRRFKAIVDKEVVEFNAFGFIGFDFCDFKLVKSLAVTKKLTRHKWCFDSHRRLLQGLDAMLKSTEVIATVHKCCWSNLFKS